MEKSPFALSVDNSLLDSIHPLLNSNSEKFPTPRNRVYTYCINKQTRKHTAAQRPAPVIRMCTYTSPRNKPDAEGKSGPCWCVCLENKNASFETCILNSPPTSLFSLPQSPYPSHVHPRSPLRRYRVLPLAIHVRLRVVLAYFSSRIRNVPCLCFFRFFLCIFGSAIFQQQPQQCS